MSFKDMIDTIISEAVFSKTPDDWELPMYGFKKGPEGSKRFQMLNSAQKAAFYAYRNYFNDLIRIHGSDVKFNPDLSTLPEKEQLEKLRKEWEKVFPEAKAVIPNRATQKLYESEEEVLLNNIIQSAIEKVGIIPDKDVNDAERILKKYNGDYALALNALAKKINETDNKAISERFVNCIRVIHAMKMENTGDKI